MSGTYMSKAAFKRIYDKSEWGAAPMDDGPSFYSGTGASPELCAPYLRTLQALLDQPHVQRVVEVGCGDLRLTSALDFSNVEQYTCLDVAPQVIENANGKLSAREFDAATQQLPEGDLLVIKDVLQHWPTQAVKQFQLQIPNFHYALVTNDAYYTHESAPEHADCEHSHRQDIPFGGYAPVAMCGGVEETDHVCQHPGKTTVLYHNTSLD